MRTTSKGRETSLRRSGDGGLQSFSNTFADDDVPIQLVLRRGPEPLAGRGVIAAVQVTCHLRNHQGHSA